MAVTCGWQQGGRQRVVLWTGTVVSTHVSLSVCFLCEFPNLRIWKRADIDSKNGLRDDVAKVVEDLRPSFLRFPGGNNM